MTGASKCVEREFDRRGLVWALRSGQQVRPFSGRAALGLILLTGLVAAFGLWRVVLTGGPNDPLAFWATVLLDLALAGVPLAHMWLSLLRVTIQVLPDRLRYQDWLGEVRDIYWEEVVEARRRPLGVLTSRLSDLWVRYLPRYTVRPRERKMRFRVSFGWRREVTEAFCDEVLSRGGLVRVTDKDRPEDLVWRRPEAQRET